MQIGDLPCKTKSSGVCRIKSSPRGEPCKAKLWKVTSCILAVCTSRAFDIKCRC